MPKIRELSPYVADLIAAGEVVERPSSVVKELIENAVDAKSTRIECEIRSGGITYMRVTDNGCGIDPEDVETAFLRHATSKLREAKDLEAIRTLGFRGEALAAIAAVSRIELYTKTPDRDLGIHMSMVAGAVTEKETRGCPDGTTMIIRDLFFNTPARMKFLKRDATEAGYIAQVVEHEAVAHPEISFRLIRDNKEVFRTSGNGEMDQAIYAVYGPQFKENLVPASYETETASVKGFISKPAACRGNRSMQSVFVNGRFIRSKLIQAALEEAYKNRMLVGRYPACVLDIRVPAQSVDVNVHPTKIEVKFVNERNVFDLVYRACKQALDGFSERPEIRFENKKPPREDKIGGFQQHFDRPAGGNIPPAPVTPAFQTAKPAQSRETGSITEKERENADYLYRPQKPAEEKAPVKEERMPRPELIGESAVSEKPADIPFDPDYRFVGEIFKTYIIVEDRSGVLMIDKHALHERMIFDGLKASDPKFAPQLLLEPQVVTVPRVEFSLLREHLDEIRKIGFDIDEFSEESFIVREVPPYIGQADVAELLSELYAKIHNAHKPGLDVLDELLHSVSCKAAVKAGNDLAEQELRTLVDTVMRTPSLQFCPHGRPVAVRLTKYQLEKQFFRIQ